VQTLNYSFCDVNSTILCQRVTISNAALYSTWLRLACRPASKWESWTLALIRL